MGKRIYRSVEEFSPDQVEKFNEMHEVLTAYNKSIGTKNELQLPQYSDAEMLVYSCYRELLIAKLCREEDQ